MSIWDKAKAKAEELLGRAEQVYGQSHGDAAATVAGEAHVMEAQALEDQAEHEASEGREHGGRPTDDDGLAGSR